MTITNIKAAMLMAIETASLIPAKLRGRAARRSVDSQPAPVHPGEVVWKALLAPSADALAQAIGVPAIQLEQLVRGQAPVTNDMAVRLAHYFGTSAQFWRSIQSEYDASQLAAAR